MDILPHAGAVSSYSDTERRRLQSAQVVLIHGLAFDEVFLPMIL